MPRIKSLLNGEVSNVRGDIAREMIKLGVAVAIDPIEEINSKRKGYAVVSTDGTVAPDHEPPYRLPKPGDYKGPVSTWMLDNISGEPEGITWVAIRRDTTHGNMVDTVYCVLPPDAVHDRSNHNGEKFCSVFGVPVPKDILEQYRRAWKSSPSQRAPYKGQFKPHPDKKSDIAAIGASVAASTERGVLEGVLQLDKPGPRI